MSGNRIVNRRAGVRQRSLLWALLLVGVVLIVLPVLAMFYGSVQTTILGSDRQFTLEAVQRVYLSAPYLRTLGGTIVLSAFIALFASLLGAMFAWLMNRTDMPGRSWIEVLVMAPIFLSPFIGAIAWVTLAAPRSGMINVVVRQWLGIEGHVVDIMSMGGVVWVLGLYYAPYAYLFVSAALKNMDPALEEASALNGAGMYATIRKITFPLAWPAVAASFFFIAVLSAGVFSVPGVLGVSSDFTPLSVRLFRSVSGFPQDYPQGAAIGTLLFWFTIAGIYFYRRSVRASHRYVTVTARGYRPRRISLGKFGHLASTACLGYALLSVILPYAALIVISLTPFSMTDLTRLTLTSDNWISVLTAPNVREALKNTVTIALIAPSLAVVLGVVSAYSIQRDRVRGASTLEYIMTMPVAIPGIVFGTGMIWMYIRTPLYATVAILVVAYVASYIPHALRLGSNGLMQIDRSLEEASTVNGAPDHKTIRKITLPLSKPAMLSAWVLIFIFVVREINTAIVLYSPRSNVLSVMTWDFIQDGRVARAAVVGLLQTLLLMAGVVAARFLFRVKLTNEGGP